MTQQAQAEALRLAERVERRNTVMAWSEHDAIASELRRLHARVQELEARKPMTEEEILELKKELWIDEPDADIIGFTRAIERAHNIGVEK